MGIYVVSVVILAVLLILALPVIQRLITEEFKWPSLFRAGVLVYTETRFLPWPLARPGSVFVTETGRFKNAGPGLCLFHSLPEDWLRERIWIIGRILWTGRQARVEARLSILSALYALLLPAGLTYFASRHGTVKFSSYVPVDSAVFILIIWVITAAFIFLAIIVTRRDARKLADEYEAYVTGQHGKMDSRFRSTAVTPR
jgi:hypothetical protein